MSAFTPVLLDRLSSHEATVVPVRQHSVLARLKTDLSRLFNAPGLAWALDASATPHVARSVLNYGVSNIAGNTLSSLDPKVLEKRIMQAIFAFEPRIVRHSLRVTWVPRKQASIPELHFEIEGLVRDGHAPQAFTFRSSWNAETGEARIGLPKARAAHG